MTAARRQCVAAFPRRLAANPYCGLLYDHVQRLGVRVVEGRTSLRWLVANRRHVGVLHLHWPELHYRGGSVVAALALVVRLGLARLLGYRLVWTMHNAAPHEGAGRAARLVHAALVRLATVIVHCEAARRTLPPAAAARAWIIPHGHYLGTYPPAPSRAAARLRLGLERDARVLLAFGQVRAYKGLDRLVEAFAKLPTPAARLLIAGEPHGDAAAVLARARDPRLRLLLRRIPDDEVPLLFAAADLVVLPYRAVLTSGAAMLAFGYGRGVLAPRLGCLAELEDSGAVVLYDADAPAGLAAAVAQAMTVDVEALGRAGDRLVRGISWEAIARRHLAAYRLVPALVLLRPSGAAEAGGRRNEENAWTS
jgi:beta-1,4-mannosyltransferase